MATVQPLDRPEVTALLEEGEQAGCVELSQVDELARTLGLSDDEIEALEEEIGARGLALRDDCGRAGVEPTSWPSGSSKATSRRSSG